MKSFFTIVLLSLTSFNSWGQNSFPAQYTGIWKGELNIYSKGKSKPLSIPMELHIQPGNTDTIWKWAILYKAANKESDVRNYSLIAKDTAKGEYLIDEHNGILLTSTLLGNTLVFRFSVTNNLLLIKYTFSNESIVYEVVAGKENEVEETGNQPKNDIPVVKLYPVGNYQKAILKKEKN